jgi:hypothetical protein
VRNTVADPANRTLTVTLEYERARQRGGQSVKEFVTELEVLEEQMPEYTEEQKVRHLLAKMTPAIRDALIAYVDLPSTRQGLVTAATRIENANAGVLSHKRHASDQQPPQERSQKQPRGRREGGEPSFRKRGAGQPNKPDPTSPYDKSRVECYGCHKRGHYKSECPHPNLWDLAPSKYVRKAVAGAPQFGRQPEQQDAPKGRGLARRRS